MDLLINEKMEHQAFTSIIATLISNSNAKGKKHTQSVTVTKDRVERLVKGIENDKRASDELSKE